MREYVAALDKAACEASEAEAQRLFEKGPRVSTDNPDFRHRVDMMLSTLPSSCEYSEQEAIRYLIEKEIHGIRRFQANWG